MNKIKQDQQVTFGMYMVVFIVVCFFIFVFLSSCSDKSFDTICVKSYDVYEFNLCKCPYKSVILYDMPKNYDDVVVKLISDNDEKTVLSNYVLTDSLIVFDLSGYDCLIYSNEKNKRIEIKIITLK